MQFSHETIDGTTSITIAGEFDSRTAPKLEALLKEIVTRKPKRVVVDLAKLDSMDEATANAVRGLADRVRESGGTVEVVNLRGQRLSIFKVLRLDKGFDLGA